MRRFATAGSDSGNRKVEEYSFLEASNGANKETI